ncbi:hypothetical protein [Polyangium sp. y55x31]|uniref:hypothetical protein n=1 Tax=Polyangium sp. y55x31 TaxID=3042688 RepID=UPI002482D285|nr:hypothetical protein [Polyangium sp. y55x31]
MIQIQADIFEKLRASIEQAGEHGRAIDIDKPRWIKGNALDVDALKKASLVASARVSTHGVITVCRYANCAFVVLPGEIAGRTGIPDLLEQTEQNAGLLALALSDPQVIPAVEALAIVDAVFGHAGEFEIGELLPLFSNPVLFQFATQHEQRKPPELLSLAQAACAHQILEKYPSGWFSTSKTLFQDICRGEVARFAGDALLSATMARESHHAFLQLYRAFEGLFRIMLVQSFAAKVRQKLDEHMMTISHALVDELTWRMRDDVAFQKLVGLIDEVEAKRIADRLGVAPDKIVKTVYETRNRIAHGSILYRPPSLTAAFIEGCLLLLQQAFVVVRVAESWIPETI